MAGSEASLSTVARLRAEAERQAGDALRGELRRLDEEQSRLAAVRTLLADYESRTAFACGASSRLRDVRSFVARLRAGAESQAAAVERQRRVAEAARAHWIAARLQREAIDRVLDERKATEERRRERSEQRQIDDRGLRRPLDAFASTITIG